MTLEYQYKSTSELTKPDIEDMINIFNLVFPGWGGEQDFRWKFSLNPYGNSQHMIARDEGHAVGTVSFWRNDLDAVKSYQCVDLGVLPSHQRLGIFGDIVPKCIDNLRDSFVYTYPGSDTPSYLGFIKQGWLVNRRAPITWHHKSDLVKKFESKDMIPGEYVEWRFVNHPWKQYYVYRKGGLIFLLSKLRQHCYAVAGTVSKDYDLPSVHPWFLLSYDFPDHPIVIPRRAGFYLEHPSCATFLGDIPSYRSDTL